ncbi:tail protein X [Shewanella sp. VB17]|nr:tail protein X [Shewanella sp. VB17]
MNDKPLGEYYRTKSGEMLDSICHQYYQGRQRTTEQVLEANCGLAKLGAILPPNTVIFMPELAPSVDDSKVFLWD